MASDNLVKCADIAADLVNIVSSILHQGGVVPAIFELSQDYSLLKTIDQAALKLELASLSKDDRAVVEQAFDARLALYNKDIQSRVVQGVSLVDAGYDLVLQVIAMVKQAESLFQPLPA